MARAPAPAAADQDREAAAPVKTGDADVVEEAFGEATLTVLFNAGATDGADVETGAALVDMVKVVGAA